MKAKREPRKRHYKEKGFTALDRTLRQRADKAQATAKFWQKFQVEDLGTPGMRSAASLRPGYVVPLPGSRGEKNPNIVPKVQVTADELYRLAQLQVTVEEAASYFLTTPSRMERMLVQQPALRDAWAAGLGLGKISFRRLGLHHAAGDGTAAVAAWIHLSKFILGYSERTIDPKGSDPEDQGEFSGAVERLAGRIARIIERRSEEAVLPGLIIEGSSSPGVGMELVGPPPADGADPSVAEREPMAEVVHSGRPGLGKITDPDGDSAVEGGERDGEEGSTGSPHGL